MNRPVPEGSTAVFIDGANSHSTTRALDFAIDYERFRRWVDKGYGPILRMHYYTCINEDDGERQSIKPLLDWLDYNGYRVVTKRLKTFDNGGQRKTKGDINVDLTVDMLTLAPAIRNVVILSGDGSLKRAVEEMQKRGVHVTVISSIKTQPASIADELRRASDMFIDYVDIADMIEAPQQKVVNG